MPKGGGRPSIVQLAPYIRVSSTCLRLRPSKEASKRHLIATYGSAARLRSRLETELSARSLTLLVAQRLTVPQTDVDAVLKLDVFADNGGTTNQPTGCLGGALDLGVRIQVSSTAASIPSQGNFQKLQEARHHP